jgi:hypothetical protein
MAAKNRRGDLTVVGAGKSNKYRAKRTPCGHGHTHSSGGEARRCDDLHLLQRAGEIRGLEAQPEYWFQLEGAQIKHSNGRRLGYKPDWRYWEGDQHIAEEYKGFRTEAYVLKLAFFKAFFPYVTHRETGRG